MLTVVASIGRNITSPIAETVRRYEGFLRRPELCLYRFVYLDYMVAFVSPMQSRIIYDSAKLVVINKPSNVALQGHPSLPAGTAWKSLLDGTYRIAANLHKNSGN